MFYTRTKTNSVGFSCYRLPLRLPNTISQEMNKNILALRSLNISSNNDTNKVCFGTISTDDMAVFSTHYHCYDNREEGGHIQFIFHFDRNIYESKGVTLGE